MKYLAHALKSVSTEVFIIVLLVFLINNYFHNEEVRIKADAVGYYDYLPSIFIHHDFVRFSDSAGENPVLYKRINEIDLYLDFNEYKVNKCPCGTAVCELPFFLNAYWQTDRDGSITDGYQRPFQDAIFYASVFYLFLALFFLKKTLKLYDVKYYVIVLSQLLLCLGTAVTNYSNYDAGYSHVYSLFAISAFIYYIKSYFTKRNFNHFIIACFFLGLITILRHFNLLIILFVPFLAGSFPNLKDAFLSLLRNWPKTLAGVLLFFIVCAVQCLAWYLQTGTIFLNSYPDESFNFFSPQFFNILFSYKKGLFIYTPVLFFALISIIWLLFKRKYYLFLSWTFFFVFLTWFLSSWWSWWFGCSYGLRAYIDFYAIFFIPIALLFNGVHFSMKVTLITISLLTVPLNIIQTYQYKYCILDWIDMNKEKYWNVFLRTDDKYVYLLWKKHIDYTGYRIVKEYFLGDINVRANTDTSLVHFESREIPMFDKARIIHVAYENNFRKEDDTEVIIHVDKSDYKHSYAWRHAFSIRFPEKGFNLWQTGHFNFELNPANDNAEKIIRIEVVTGEEDYSFKNLKIKFLIAK
jgi:hypothetical protein